MKMRLVLACFAIAFATRVVFADSVAESMRYNAYWTGLKVGEMVLESGSRTNSEPYLSLRVGSRSFARLFSGDEMEFLSEKANTSSGTCLLFYKRLVQAGFHQHDVMRLWPDSGIAIWDDFENGSSTTSSVPVGSLDIASFFHGFRAMDDLDGLQTNAISRVVVMDGATHPIAISTGRVVRVNSKWGRTEAREYFVRSYSDTLFVRNVPKCIKVSTNMPVIVEMDVETGLGTVHFKLNGWETNAIPVLPDW